MGHDPTSPTPGLAAAGISAAGTVYTHKFTTTGSYPYFCWVHWNMGMTGSVTVN